MSPAASGEARQRVFSPREGREGARRAGRVGGKQRGYSQKQESEVRKLLSNGTSIRASARIVRLTKSQVEAIDAAAKVSG
jgi:DNA invertase Pin-like site-specific DNA recombinase